MDGRPGVPREIYLSFKTILMPKIGKYTYRHDEGNILLDFEIWFGTLKHNDDVPWEVQRDKNFYIRLPQILITYYNKKTIYNKNHDDLEEEFYKMAREYYNQSITKKKVICLQFDWDLFTEEVREQELDRIRFDPKISTRDHYEQVPTIKFKIRYEIGYIVTIGSRRFFSVAESDNLTDIEGEDPEGTQRRYHNSSPTKGKFIDWTPEREAWVTNTYNSFNEMINKCKQFYEQTEEDITKKIDTVGLRLLNNE